MKRLAAAVLISVFITVLLTGCGKKPEQTEQTVSGGKTVVSIITTSKMPFFEAMFETRYPDIDLQVEVMNTAVIAGEMVRRLRNNHGSDIMVTSLPAGEIAQYTYDLSALGFTEKYQASIMHSTLIDGRCRYLPLPGGYYCYILNKTLLDRLGLPLPETKQDLLAVLDTAKQAGIGVNEGGYGFGLSDAGATFLGAYFTADFSTDFLSKAEGARWLAAFASEQTAFTGVWESSIDFIKACIEKGYMDAGKIIVNYNGHLDTNSNAFKAEDAMPAGKAILTFGNIDMYEHIRSSTDDEIIMLPCLPSGESGNKLISAVSNNYIAINAAIADDEAKLGAALSVLEYLSTQEGQEMWIADTRCYHSYLNGYSIEINKIPESIRSYVENKMIFVNPFPTNILSYMGKQLSAAAKGSTSITDALALIDDYYINGREDADYDMSVVGSIGESMIYENSNTRYKETELGNFISDAIREMTGADVALVNGGGIRSSLYAGDIKGDDLAVVCPYGNLIIVAKMTGKTLREAVTNGIQKTWKPAGQFLQVSGIKYAYKPAADESETALLVSLTYPDGSVIKDEDTITVAYTNYMGGSGGYVDAGDGYTMLNVYDPSLPVSVELISETGKTYSDALRAYFKNHSNEIISYKLEGRIEIVY